MSYMFKVISQCVVSDPPLIITKFSKTQMLIKSNLLRLICLLVEGTTEKATSYTVRISLMTKTIA